MIKERYVSFEIAKLLKEKGFNEECEYFYDEYDKNEYVICSNGSSAYNDDKNPTYYSMPTLYMTMEWLREKGVYMYVEPFITISSEGYNLKGFKPWITTFKTNWFNPLSKIGTTTYSKTYEKAVEVSIMFALENLILYGTNRQNRFNSGDKEKD